MASPSQGRGVSTIFYSLAVCYFVLLFLGTGHALMLGVKDHRMYCVLLQANITGIVQYTDEKNVSRSSNFTVPNGGSTKIAYPGSAKLPSHCGQHQQQMTIEFVPDGFNHTELEADNTWYLTLQFNRTGTKEQGTFSLANYTLDVRFFNVQNASSHYNGTYLYAKAPSFKPEWSATVQNGQPNIFTCSKNGLHLDEKSSLNFDNLKVVAFANETKLAFNNETATEPCLMDVRTSDLIPIIVGACLAGLVVIVLVAYLIGRARAKRQGYTSV
ncbi:hypothetical protein niasHT_011968 [Heterodera trifolii]|uniref:Lysosome-associated membrane glycoprotein 2-like transmembrane domain-containing protein n=1 Tax=Heterodera trifolii TaxID=157864 RepID=A0ABD2LKC8_9BILA